MDAEQVKKFFRVALSAKGRASRPAGETYVLEHLQELWRAVVYGDGVTAVPRSIIAEINGQKQRYYLDNGSEEIYTGELKK